MPLLKYGRQWTQQALAWGEVRLARAERPAVWNESDLNAITCARKGCQWVGTKSALTSNPVFYEGKDVCSRVCLHTLIANEVQDAFQPRRMVAEPYIHRMPLGLLMLSRKWITHEQLTLALARQRTAGHGRIGEWLIATGAVQEQTVAQAVAAQWGLPVLSANHQSPDVAGFVPLVLMNTYGAIPVRIAAERILYLAVEQQVHPSLNRAIEKMTGFHVEPVILASSTYERLERAASNAELCSGTPADRLFRARSSENLSSSILSLVDEAATRNIQIATIGMYIWVRLLRSSKDGLDDKTENIIFALPPLPHEQSSNS